MEMNASSDTPMAINIAETVRSDRKEKLNNFLHDFSHAGVDLLFYPNQSRALG
jgi:hypothetical protein